MSRSVSHSDVSLELMQDMRTEHETCDAAVVPQKKSSAVSADIYQACMCPASATSACSSAVIKATPGGVNVAARRPGVRFSLMNGAINTLAVLAKHRVHAHNI